MSGMWAARADALRRRSTGVSTVDITKIDGYSSDVANQEVTFGMAGQTLSIRHETINRECFMPGVILAVKEVVKRPGLTNGLETLLNLQES